MFYLFYPFCSLHYNWKGLLKKPPQSVIQIFFACEPVGFGLWGFRFLKFWRIAINKQNIGGAKQKLGVPLCFITNIVSCVGMKKLKFQFSWNIVCLFSLPRFFDELFDVIRTWRSVFDVVKNLRYFDLEINLSFKSGFERPYVAGMW